MRLCDFHPAFALLQNLFYMPADEVGCPTEEINTTYKHNYPRQQALVIEKWEAGGVSIFLGLEESGLTYCVIGLPEDG